MGCGEGKEDEMSNEANGNIILAIMAVFLIAWVVWLAWFMSTHYPWCSVCP